MKRKFRSVPDHRRRAIVAVYTAALMFVLLGFAALTIDVGAMYGTRADLQDAADAAALAAATALSDGGGGNAVDHARATASAYVGRNSALGRDLAVDPATDVVFGRAQYDEQAAAYIFTPTDFLPDAVRVEVRMTSDSPNGAMPLYFARIFGKSSTNVKAHAIAMMVPRDIAIAVDLSGSINDDSELRNYDRTPINLVDVWSALPIERGTNGVGDGVTPPPPGDPNNPAPPPGVGPGGPGNSGTDPGTDPMGGQTGPTWGWMYYWGDSIDASYDPATDPGLISLPRYSNWNDADLTTWYQNVGYSPEEIDALNSSSNDGSSGSTGPWANRVAIALGLARWNSGVSGGLWESIPPAELNGTVGNGNTWIGSGELTWLVDYPFNQGSWSDFIYNYVRKSNSRMANANSDFRYKFGPKTLVNYLLERRSSNNATPELADTPSQPTQAVKDAVGYMVDLLTGLGTNDLISLESYATTTHHEVDLTNNFELVRARMNELQAGYYDTMTNMGGGLDEAILELTGSRARGASKKVIVLLTDGNANVAAGGQYSYDGGASYVLAEASRAADLGIRIFAVSVGSGANQALMQQIASIGGGEYFHAQGTIDQYSAQLGQIFMQIGGARPVELIE